MANPKYRIVEFTEEKSGTQKVVDIVPADWINYDAEKNILVTKFMPPPYQKDTIGTLHSFVQYCMPPSENWPTFPIELRGEAKNYNEGLQKLKCLNDDDTVYTSDEDMTAKQRAHEATKKYVTAKSSATTRSEDWSVPAVHFVEHQEESGGNTVVQRSDSPAPSSAQEIASDDTVTDERILYDFDNVIVATCPKNNEFDEDFKTELKESLLRIEKHLKVLTREVCSLRAQNDAAKLNNIQPDFLSKQDHGLDLPFRGQDEFEEFEHMIHSDKDRKGKIKWLIWQNVDTSSAPIDSLRRVLKIFLTPAVIESYTAVKDTKQKKVFAKTNFFAELQTILLEKYSQSDKMISCKDIEKSLEKVFNAAKDWNGARQARKRANIVQT